MRIQYKKVIEDLFVNLSKTILVILSISLGIFSLGVILDTYSITDREMTESYKATNPASFIVAVDKPDINLINELSNNKNIEMIQERKTIISRIYSDDNKIYKATIYVLQNKDDLKINTFYPLSGNSFPQKGEILLEKSSVSVVDKTVGDNISIKMPKTNINSLNLSGIVQADGTNPAWMHEEVIGYISEDTLEYMNAEQNNTEILIVNSSDINKKQNIAEFSENIRKEIEKQGYKVNYVAVPEPDVHPNASQMNAILLLFRIFGTLSLVLSSILIYCIISSVLQGQVKQIAIMKSMGATTSQIALMYYLYVLILGTVSAVLAIPTAKIISESLCDFTSAILVFTVRDYSVSLNLYILQIVIALIVPLSAATFPILKGSSTTIIKGLYDNEKSGFSEKRTRKISHDSFSLKSTGVSVGLRNTFRKPSRLALSVFTLGLGGAILMASINVRVSLESTLCDSLSKYNMDTQFVLSEDYSNDTISDVLSEVDGIESIRFSEVSYGTLIDDAEGEVKNNTFDNSVLVKEVSIVYSQDADPEATYQNTEKAFYDNKIDVISGITIITAEKIYNKHLYTVASFLIGASVIVILVGIISLVSLSGMNISERIKELGIMRSFGADSHSVFIIVYIENMITGLMGFISAIILSIPITVVIGKQFGEIFLNKPLINKFSLLGAIIWFAMSITICTIVSLTSVGKVLKMPVNQNLAYE